MSSVDVLEGGGILVSSRGRDAHETAVETAALLGVVAGNPVEVNQTKPSRPGANTNLTR